MTVKDIQEILPHRYPFLLVDKVLSIHDTTIVAQKNISANEAIFNGHFPNHPVYPGVLIVESLAQAGAILLLSMDEHKGKLALLVGIEAFKFRRQVVPGDVLQLEVSLVKMKGVFGIAECIARVEGEMCAKGTIKFAVHA